MRNQLGSLIDQPIEEEPPANNLQAVEQKASQSVVNDIKNKVNESKVSSRKSKKVETLTEFQ